ncbi:MAG: hydroxymethylbilane synthase [Opitutales bacterium]|nr:hydroxymethylbilane synthase [Opitutales bacterium]
MNCIRIATRRSRLALAQADLARSTIAAVFPAASLEVLEMVTTGDKQLSWSLEERGGKGLFTKELEEALLNGQADVAVHSAKDLPSEMPEGLSLVGCLPREDARDMLIFREGVETPAVIATGSPRRRAQLKKRFPCAVWTEIRGNVETRLQKIADGKADATVLACAGLKRLGISAFPGLVFEPISPESVIPAAGQAAIALQCRTADLARFKPLVDVATTESVEMERYLLNALGGGCHTSVAVFREGNTFRVYHESFGAKRYTLDERNPLESVKAVVAEIILKIGNQ